ncbi:MAG: orotate phosphoribosyltransferase [Candidatus Omnitrophica bacterium]|nr:orotate phosphoribosyltransferase [Candidatus Omnitrophota bacterium]
MDKNRLKEQLYRLVKEKAYHEGQIKLASGKMSHYYLDARAVTLSSEGAYLVGSIIFDLVKDLNVAAVGGPTLGADPMVGALAVMSYQNKRPINTFLIRKTPKAHGRMLQVEGPEIKSASEVVLLDDVATTGGSLIESIAILKKIGIVVRRAIVIIDRNEGAKENLSREGCELISIFQASEFFSSKIK